jgi:hypothetical protein
MKVSQFNEVITKLLSERLKAYREKNLDLVVCVEIYQTIFDTLVEVFEKANSGLTNEAMNYLSQQYYDAVSVNNSGQGLDPDIFTQRAKLESIETKELALLAVMLNGTDFAIPLIQEVKRRG